MERSLPTMQRTGRTLQSSHVDAASIPRVPTQFTKWLFSNAQEIHSFLLEGRTSKEPTLFALRTILSILVLRTELGTSTMTSLRGMGVITSSSFGDFLQVGMGSSGSVFLPSGVTDEMTSFLPIMPYALEITPEEGSTPAEIETLYYVPISVLNVTQSNPALEKAREVPGQLETIKGQTTSISKLLLIGWLSDCFRGITDNIPDGSRGIYDVATRVLKQDTATAKEFGSSFNPSKRVKK